MPPTCKSWTDAITHRVKKSFLSHETSDLHVKQLQPVYLMISSVWRMLFHFHFGENSTRFFSLRHQDLSRPEADGASQHVVLTLLRCIWEQSWSRSLTDGRGASWCCDFGSVCPHAAWVYSSSACYHSAASRPASQPHSDEIGTVVIKISD